MESVVMKEARIEARLILKRMDKAIVADGGRRFRDLSGAEAMMVLRTLLANTEDAEHDGEFVMPTLVAREAVNQWCREMKRWMRIKQEQRNSEEQNPEVPF